MPPDAAPQTIEDFRKRLGHAMESLPKRLRQCADFLTLNNDKIAVCTVAELAQAAGVQPSAVVRFCQFLGFSGFSELQKLYRQGYTQNWPNYTTRLHALDSAISRNPFLLLSEFVATGHASLNSLASTVDESTLQDAVEILVDAPTIHLIGLQRVFPIACYMAYAFGKMSVAAHLHDRIGDLDQQHLLRPGDALIAISYAPYAQNTLDAANLAASRGVSVVAITDAHDSPLQSIAFATLLVREVDMGDFRALSASFALAITLVTAVGARRGQDRST